MHAHGGKASFSNGPKGQGKGKGKSKGGSANGKGGPPAAGNPAWQAAFDAYQKILQGSTGAPAVPKSGVWACKGPGGCSHDSNPPQAAECVLCGLPWSFSARPAFWQALANRQQQNPGAGKGQGQAGPAKSTGQGGKGAAPGMAKPAGPVATGNGGSGATGEEWEQPLSKKQKQALRKLAAAEATEGAGQAQSPAAEGLAVDSDAGRHC